MPFQAQTLSPAVTQDLDRFLRVQSFPGLYRAYGWQNDRFENAFPDIYRLESQLVIMERKEG